MSAWPLTSATLLSQLRNVDDRSAWDRFAELYRPAVYRFARRMGLQDADADDIAQRVLESVRNAFANRPPDLTRWRFRAWISQITRNAAINVIQRDLRNRGTGQSAVLDNLHERSNVSSDLESAWKREEEVVLYRTAAAEVRSGCTASVWTAFEQTAVEGRSTSTVAEELGVSAGVVYASRSRVLKRIRNVIERLVAEREDRDGGDS